VPSELGNDPVCDLGNINSGNRTMGTIRNQSSQDVDEVYTGLRAQDLQEAKDQLVVETADMLHIPLFTAEALLRDNGIAVREPSSNITISSIHVVQSGLEKSFWKSG